jgi:hypothetical protein
VVSLPQIGIVSSPASANRLFEADRTCPEPTRAAVKNGFTCLNHWAWEKRPVLLDGLGGWRSASGALLGVVFVFGVGGLVAWQYALAQAHRRA